MIRLASPVIVHGTNKSPFNFAIAQLESADIQVIKQMAKESAMEEDSALSIPDSRVFYLSNKKFTGTKDETLFVSGDAFWWEARTQKEDVRVETKRFNIQDLDKKPLDLMEDRDPVPVKVMVTGSRYGLVVLDGEADPFTGLVTSIEDPEGMHLHYSVKEAWMVVADHAVHRERYELLIDRDKELLAVKVPGKEWLFDMLEYSGVPDSL